MKKGEHCPISFVAFDNDPLARLVSYDPVERGLLLRLVILPAIKTVVDGLVNRSDGTKQGRTSIWP